MVLTTLEIITEVFADVASVRRLIAGTSFQGGREALARLGKQMEIKELWSKELDFCIKIFRSDTEVSPAIFEFLQQLNHRQRRDSRCRKQGR